MVVPFTLALGLCLLYILPPQARVGSACTECSAHPDQVEWAAVRRCRMSQTGAVKTGLSPE